MQHNSGVYEIVNKSNGHAYGGSSVNISKRRKDHFRALRKGTHKNRYLQNAWNKYGENIFEFSLLMPLSPETLLLHLVEQECLDEWFGNRWCYNFNSRASGASPEMAKRNGRRLAQWHKDNPEESHRLLASMRLATSRWSKDNPEEACRNAAKASMAAAKWARDNPKEAHLMLIRRNKAKAQWRKDHPEEARQRSLKGSKASAQWARDHPEEARRIIAKADKAAAQWREDNPEKMLLNAKAAHAEKMPDGRSKTSVWGTHVRWHINRGIINPDCPFCRTNHPLPLSPPV